MQWVYTPYVLPLFFSAATSGLLGVYLIGRRQKPGAASFAILNLATAIWAICDIMEIGSLDLPDKIIWNRLEYIGIAMIPVCWLTFALLYGGFQKWVTRRNVVFLLIIPVLTLIFDATNDLHGLISNNYHLVNNEVFLALGKTYGGWFWVFAAYSYLLLFSGSVFLIRSMINTSRRYTRQIIPILVAIILPWLANVIHLTDLNPIPGMDLTPITFSVSGAILLWMVFRSWLFDLIPVAHTTVVQSMADGLLVIDDQNRLVELNPAAANILGIKPTKQIGEKIEFVFARFSQSGERTVNILDPLPEVTLGEGESARSFELKTTPINLREKHLSGKLIVLHEITRRKRIENELEKSNALLLATLEATADGILVTNLRGKPIRFNRRLIEMWRVPDTVTGSQDDQVMLSYIADQVVNPAAFYQLANRMSSEPDSESYDMIELKDGRVFERYSRPQRIGDKRSGRVWSFHDITEQRRAAEKLRFLSTHDIMTGLYNRVFFEEEINRLEGSRQYPISIIIADVDGLKETNDVYGHSAGDALLRRAAEILRQACRSEDMVARLGGDEFGIILPYSNTEVANRAIQRIQNSLPTLRIDGKEIPVSLSLGARTAENGVSLHKVLREADQAMYEVKRAKHHQKLRKNLQMNDRND